MATRVIFQDPIYQYPNRYRLTDIGGGLYEIESEPGTITQEGTLLSANNLNATAEEVIFHTIDTGENANEFITAINNLADYYNGLSLVLKSNTTNTGSCTINISSLGNKNIKKINTSGNKIDLQANDIIKNKYELLVYDGIDFVLSNPAADLATVISDLNNLTIKVNTIETDVNTIKNKVVHFAVSSGTNNAYTVNVSGITSLYAGLQINVVASFSNTGSSTLQINSLESKTIKLNQNNLIGNEIKINNIFTVIFDGVNWQLQPTMSQMQQRKTYSELKTLKDNNQLVSGTQYVLTDYRTKYRQPYTNVIKSMDIEELILTASSTSTFEPIVSSNTYPQDVIYYDFNNAVCEDNITSRNGFILRRYDPISGNDAPQDWRTMLWARWKPHPTAYYKDDNYVSYAIWTSGDAYTNYIYKSGNSLYVAKDNVTPTSPTDANVFEKICDDINEPFLKNIEKHPVLSYGTSKLELRKGDLGERLTFGNNCKNNTIEAGASLHNNVFGDNCNGNKLGKNCYENTFGNTCSSNYFKNSCNYNIFRNGFYANNLNSACANNIFGINCSYNSLGNDCGSNIFGNDCYYNSFDNNCDSNSLGSNCSSNKFDVKCYHNKFGISCNHNNFGNNCDVNVFGDSCNDNSFGNSCAENTIGKVNSNIVLGNYCKKNTFGNYNGSIMLYTDCGSNSIGDNKHFISMKRASFINISNISLPTNQNYTIERDESGKYRYWYLDTNGNVKSTIIP